MSFIPGECSRAAIDLAGGNMYAKTKYSMG